MRGRLRRWREDVLMGALASPLVPRAVRCRLLTLLGVQATGARIAAGTMFKGRRTRIAHGAFVGERCYVEAVGAPVTIEPGVYLAPECRIITTTHAIGSPESRAGRLERRPVAIGAGSWLGVGATVLPGVTIAPGCVVAAGSVVASSTEPHGLYAGAPATRRRDLSSVSA